MTDELLGCSCLLSSMLERERNDAMPFFSFRPAPSRRLFFNCLPQLVPPPPSGSWDERAAAMIAWRMPLPACLSVVDLPVSSRRAGRGAGRIRLRFCLGGRFRARLVLPSRGAWLMSSADCFDDLPSCLLFACYHCPSRPASRLSSRMASRCACLGSRCVFLVYFRIVPRWGCDCLICPRAPSRLSSRRSVSSCVSDGGIIVMCLLDLFPMAFSSRPCRFVGRDGERGGATRFRNPFHGIFMNWE